MRRDEGYGRKRLDIMLIIYYHIPVFAEAVFSFQLIISPLMVGADTALLSLRTHPAGDGLFLLEGI
jgi:hypothetical protein